MRRETLEETGYDFAATGLLGIYRFRPDASADTFLRFLFCGDVGERLHERLDAEIVAAEWLEYDEIVALRERHRSPLVMQAIDHARSKTPCPLELFNDAFA